MGGRARRVLERLAREATRDERPRVRIAGLGGDLARAIERNELTLSFQPIVAVRAARCDRVEALIRWRHPAHGAIDARDLVGAAGESDLLLPLGIWVVRAVAREHRLWRRDGLALGISVNLEGGELDGRGADALLRAAADAGLAPRQLTFDVRARTAMDPAVRDGMRALAAGGARLALDDVTPADAPGRRFTSEVDELKFSRSLVLRASADQSARLALRGLVAMGRDTGLVTVAVGVEDAPTWRLLSASGCDLAQGSWASRPLLTTEVAPWQGWVARLAFSGTAALVTTIGAARPGIAAERPPASQVARLPTPPSGCCTVHALPARAPALDLETRAYDDGGVRVVVEAAIDETTARLLAATAAADRAAVETTLGASIARTPTVYVLASRGAFAHVLERSFGQSALAASALASAHGGVAFPDRAAVVLNWENVGRGPLTIVRHELTHLLVHQLAGDADLPAWLDEGLATLAERDVTADPIAELRDGATALALLSRDAVTLAALAPADGWVLGDAGEQRGAYAVSAEAVRILRERIGGDGVARLLVASRADGFASAFGSATGVSPVDFERAFPAEEARARSGLRVATRADGASTRWAVAGVAPGTSVHVTIDGDDYHVEFDVVVDGNGMYDAVFGATAPSGRYSLTAAGGGATVTTLLEVR